MLCHFHITVYFIFDRIMCFGDFLGKRTLGDAYHKEHASSFFFSSAAYMYMYQKASYQQDL